jgi:hypothetical protein
MLTAVIFLFLVGFVTGMWLVARFPQVGDFDWKLFFHPWMLIPSVEWGERWGGWPHCMDQGQCWMHLSEERRWCECKCRWCRLAHRLSTLRRKWPWG